MNTVLTLIISVFTFGILIIAHEFGHFIAAVKSGVKVLEFSVGMGPLLMQKTTETTKYSVRLLPVGGFCQMKGEDDEDDASEKGSLNAASPLKRIIILASGAAMNLLLAVLIFMVIFFITGTDPTTEIETVLDNSPAYSAGMRDGDKIISIDGTAVTEWAEITSAIVNSEGKSLQITVQRTENGETRTETFSAVPQTDSASGEYKLGIITKMKVNVFHALTNSFSAIWQYLALVAGVIGGLFTGKFKASEVFSGPIGITAEIGRQLSSNGMLPILNIAAAMAVSLAFFNLLPLPALDGGRILFTAIEAIKGSPVSRKFESRIHYIGFVLLMLLAAYVALNDILNLF